MAHKVQSVALADVLSDHVVEASFLTEPAPAQFKVTASAGPGGTITPSGEIMVDAGASLTLVVEAGPGFVIDKILVDGSDVAAHS